MRNISVRQGLSVARQPSIEDNNYLDIHQSKQRVGQESGRNIHSATLAGHDKVGMDQEDAMTTYDVVDYYCFRAATRARGKRGGWMSGWVERRGIASMIFTDNCALLRLVPGLAMLPVRVVFIKLIENHRHAQAEVYR